VPAQMYPFVRSNRPEKWDGIMSAAANGHNSGTPLEQHRARIERYICSMVRDSSEAEDLTQETFLRAHARRDSLRDPAAALGWLYRIATRVTLDRLRQKVRNEPREFGGDINVIDFANTRGPTLLKVLEQKEMSACVQGHIEKLPNTYRALILLHDLHGLTAQEIAETLDLPVPTIKIRLHRARRKLQAELGEACHFLHDEDGNLICEPKS
jgi:RNA polymerase sigma-70 factor (ECF subfamily)